MAKDNRVHMPSSGAGLTRYFDDYKAKIELNPTHVIIMICVIIVLAIILGSTFSP